MMKIKNILGLALITTTIFFTSCEKEFDTVPVKELSSENIITIDSLRNIYNGFDTTIVGDYSVYGVVTADEVSGNIYKELYIQDETNAIKLQLSSSSDFYTGDRVRIALKGLTVTRDRNMLIVSNVDPDLAIIKQDVNQDLSPEVVTIADITNLVGVLSAYQGKLIQINNVEFDCRDFCVTWADAIAQSDENRTLRNAAGDTVVVRSSGFSDFANTPLPSGKGSIIAVVSQYDETIQLTIRNPNEFTMTGTRDITCSYCSSYTQNKDFQDQSLTSGGWTTQQVGGSYNWATSDQGTSGNFYAVMSGNASSEAWLISPSIDFTAYSNARFSFLNAASSFGTALDLEVFVSTDYDGTSLPVTATWTSATIILSSGGFNFVSSGDVDLTPFISANTYVAFKYTGTSSTGKKWEIDDIKIEAL